MGQKNSIEVYIVQHERIISENVEDIKFIGVYSTKENAQEAVTRLSLQPGFSDTVDGFYIDEYIMDKDNWTEGYVTS